MQKAKYGSKMFYCSDPFLTGPYGYKMCVEFHPNGLNTGWNTHLSIFVCLLRGEYDDILPWPFTKKITFTVIDQNEDLKERNNITANLRPSSKAPIFCGRPTGHLSFDSDRMFFIPHERLQTRRYILNDNLFLQVDVGPDDWISF